MTNHSTYASFEGAAQFLLQLQLSCSGGEVAHDL